MRKAVGLNFCTSGWLWQLACVLRNEHPTKARGMKKIKRTGGTRKFHTWWAIDDSMGGRRSIEGGWREEEQLTNNCIRGRPGDFFQFALGGARGDVGNHWLTDKITSQPHWAFLLHSLTTQSLLSFFLRCSCSVCIVFATCYDAHAYIRSWSLVSRDRSLYTFP